MFPVKKTIHNTCFCWKILYIYNLFYEILIDDNADGGLKTNEFVSQNESCEYAFYGFFRLSIIDYGKRSAKIDCWLACQN